MDNYTIYYHLQNIIEAYQFKDYQLLARKILRSQQKQKIADIHRCNIPKCVKQNGIVYLCEINKTFNAKDIKGLKAILDKLSTLLENNLVGSEGRKLNGRRKSKQAG